MADAEHLPIAASLAGGDAVRWHAEALLRTVPVHGTRDGLRDIARGTLAPDLTTVQGDGGEWRELTVERRDFDAYLAWLRTMW